MIPNFSAGQSYRNEHVTNVQIRFWMRCNPKHLRVVDPRQMWSGTSIVAQFWLASAAFSSYFDWTQTEVPHPLPTSVFVVVLFCFPASDRNRLTYLALSQDCSLMTWTSDVLGAHNSEQLFVFRVAWSHCVFCRFVVILWVIHCNKLCVFSINGSKTTANVLWWFHAVWNASVIFSCCLPTSLVLPSIYIHCSKLHYRFCTWCLSIHELTGRTDMKENCVIVSLRGSNPDVLKPGIISVSQVYS